MAVNGWRPHRKVLVAGTVGPVLAAAYGLVLPHLAPVAVAPVAALFTALLAYLVPSPPIDPLPPAVVGPALPPPIDLKWI